MTRSFSIYLDLVRFLATHYRAGILGSRPTWLQNPEACLIGPVCGINEASKTALCAAEVWTRQVR